jgi:hypothetical protein
MTNMTIKLIALSTLALAAAGVANAEPGRPSAGSQVFTLEFRYDATRSPEANYDAFRRMVERKCVTPGLRPIQTIVRERACVAEVMDRFVQALGRAEIAAVHAARTGRTPAADPARDFASRG